MTVDAFKEAQRTGVLPYSLSFRDYGIARGCKHFVETGTYQGTAVKCAIDLGFEEIFSCELSEERYDSCVRLFKDYNHVNLWLGDSRKCMSKMLKEVDKKACFWLDAHADGGGVPTMEELDDIKEHHIKDHTIIIDDIPVYFSECKDQLKNKILSINPDYKFTYYKSLDIYQDYILIAYI